MRLRPTQVSIELCVQKGRLGLELTQDQYDKVMRSARLGDERMERKAQERKDERQREREERGS